MPALNAVERATLLEGLAGRFDHLEKTVTHYANLLDRLGVAIGFRGFQDFVWEIENMADKLPPTDADVGIFRLFEQFLEDEAAAGDADADFWGEE